MPLGFLLKKCGKAMIMIVGQLLYGQSLLLLVWGQIQKKNS